MIFKSVYQFIKITLFAIFAFISSTSQAFDTYEYPLMQFHVRGFSYSGDKYKSFSDSGPGFSAGLAFLGRGQNFTPIYRIDTGGQTGRQAFLDGTTELILNYAYRYTAAEIGTYYFPAKRLNGGISPYLGGTAVIGINSIELKSIQVFNALPTSDNNIIFGYRLCTGAEWFLTPRVGRPKWTLYTELGFKKENSKILNQNFSTQNIDFTVALGW